MTEARAPSPRRRRKAAKPIVDDGLSLKSLGGPALLFTAFTLASIFFILPIVRQTYLDQALLKSRGVSQPAEKLGVAVHPGGTRSPAAYLMTARFRPPGRTLSVVDTFYITRQDASAVGDLSVVPIVYDPKALSRAALNLGDIVHRRDPRGTLALGYGLIGGLLVLMWGPFTLLACQALQRRRLRRVEDRQHNAPG